MIYISKADADDWLRSRGAIIKALEKAGLCLWSNAEGFWIAPTPMARDVTRLEWFLRSRSDMPPTIDAWRAAVDAAMLTVPTPGHATPTASAPEALSDEQIDAVFMEWNSNCFGTPLSAHRRFARSILALAAP